MWLDGFAELLFPRRCASCDAPGEVLCEECALCLPLMARERSCTRCGAPLGDLGCSECAGRPLAFSQCRSVGLFMPPLSDLIVVYKDGGERRLTPVLGSLVVDRLAEWAEWSDGIVPVPARPAARSTRGFDHMLGIARHVAARTGIALQRPLVAGNAADQRLLGRDQRRANAAGRYSVIPGVTCPRRPLLLDDVFTTGATLDACASVLVASGAEEVRAAVIARATDAKGT